MGNKGLSGVISKISDMEAMHRKTRSQRVFFGRWRVYSFRSHFEHGYTRHWFVYGRDEEGRLERSINDFQLSAYRLRGWQLAAEVTVADGALGADELRVRFALPFIGQVFLSAARAGWLVRATGQEYVIGRSGWGDCERSLGVNWHGSDLTISLGGNTDVHWGTWRYRYIDLKDALLGRATYSRSAGEKHTAVLAMPEGDYPVSVELYTATWRRPRWPWPASIRRADIEVLNKGGIPFPGKGESEYDIGDDAAFEMTCPAATVEEAVERLRASVMRDREKYGSGPEWRPSEGKDE